MNTRGVHVATFLLSLIWWGANASAQNNFAIDAHVIAGGGGTSSGGSYVVIGTLGMPDAGNMSGGNFAINGGFWSLNVAVQTAGSPMLGISTSAGFVTISWPGNTTGFTLESTSVLGPGANWQPVTGVTNNSINLPVSHGTQYYRLIFP
jgi:hypothetical protein